MTAVAYSGIGNLGQLRLFRLRETNPYTKTRHVLKHSIPN